MNIKVFLRTLKILQKNTKAVSTNETDCLLETGYYIFNYLDLWVIYCFYSDYNNIKIQMLIKLDIYLNFMIFSHWYSLALLTKVTFFTSYLQEGSSLVHFTFCIFLKTNKKTSPQKLNQYLLEMDDKQRNYKYPGMKPGLQSKHKGNPRALACASLRNRRDHPTLLFVQLPRLPSSQPPAPSPRSLSISNSNRGWGRSSVLHIL